MPSNQRKRLRETFDEVPEQYEQHRPRYPSPLFEDLAELAALRPEARVLEIGCGTGQATRALARRGYDILCIELGTSLAEYARQKLARYAKVRVVTSPFEEWDPDRSSFDLVLAATSWHWLDPDLRYAKAAGVLKLDGALAIISTHHVLPEDGDQFFVEIQDTYNAIGETDSPPPPPDQVADEREAIEASNLFGDVQVRRYLWEQSYTEEQYLALLDTYSGHRLMISAARQTLYQEIHRRIAVQPDQRVRKHYLFILHVARLTA
jgi:SAM-dependent methyltransferase